MIARTMSCDNLGSAADARAQLLATSPPAPQPDFPQAVLLDELEGIPGQAEGFQRLSTI
jgi:hypothetical protein